MAVVIAGLVTTAACTIGVGEPEALTPDNRDDLVLGTTTTSLPEADLGDEPVIHDLYFIGESDKLEIVERPYPDNPEINDILPELEQAPRADEQRAFEERGFLVRTVVPVGLNAELLTRRPDDEDDGVRILRVAPDGELRGLLESEPDQARLAVKQLLCTFFAIASSDTSGVEIHDPQGRLELTDNDAQPINRPAIKEDFGSCTTGADQEAEQVEEGSDGEEGEGATSTTDPEG